jgi:hypothetical protein
MTEKKTDKSVELFVNGKKLGLNPYVTSVFVNVVLALVDTLRNVEEPRDIEIRVVDRN